MYEIMNRISEGKGTSGDLEVLQKVGEDMSQVSNCGLGQTASTAVLDILKHFRAEVEEHIHSHICRAGVCPVADLSPITNLVNQPSLA
jgi:NADH:ubiquinone oxidoreductase subunit F (NADH-binding)